MKRIAALAPWMALAGLALGAAPSTVRVEYCARGVSALPAQLLDGEAWASPALVAGWGWRARPSPEGFEVEAEGSRFAVPARRIGGSDELDLTAAVRSLEGETVWQSGEAVLEIYSQVRVVRFVNGHLLVDASLGVIPRVVAGEGGRYVVELPGCRLSPDAILDVGGGLQVSDSAGGVRVSVPLSAPAAVAPSWTAPSRDWDFDTTATTAGGAPPPPEKLKLDLESAQRLEISMPLPTRLAGQPTYVRVDARTLRISLPGEQLALDPSSDRTSPSVERATVQATPAGTDLVLTLVRPMGIEVFADSKLRIELFKPPVGNGKLAGKLVVVDPGHGGHDPGAKNQETGLCEKTLTLAIGKKLAADLAAQGATVIMTRHDDTFIPLAERAAIANRNGAALFLCVHINSNGADRKSRGSITFFHGGDPISSTLADCIERQLPKASSVPEIGVWSDTKIYRSGFLVLRATRMPGVLMELGFINNAADVKLLARDDVQSRIAAAVVEGVRVYLGERDAHEE